MADDDHNGGGAGSADEARAAADKLILAASQAAGPHRSAELARRALAIWPDCADAYNLLGELADDPAEAADLYRQGIEAGRRAVGPEFFEQAAGRFGARRDSCDLARQFAAGQALKERSLEEACRALLDTGSEIIEREEHRVHVGHVPLPIRSR